MLLSKIYRLPLIGTAFLVFPCFISAQEPVTVQPTGVYSHRIGQPDLLHANVVFGFREQDGIGLNVIVDEQGKVLSAHAISGRSQFYKEAEQIELRRRFKPFEKDGKPVRAKFHDFVKIVPPEKWASPRVPFPAVKDLNSLRIHLDRGNCFGPCLLYSVDIHGDGQVDFYGGLGMLIPGHHHSRISRQAVLELVSHFHRSDYFSLLDRYVYPITDSENVSTSIEFDGQKKSVLDYVGVWCGLPSFIKQLEDSIDETAGTEKWTKGNSQTGPALLAEGWNFQADTKENRALFANVVASGSPDLIRLCINQTGLPKTLLSCSLESAAAKGDLPLVQLLISKGAGPNAPPCSDATNWTVLMSATLSGKPDVVKQILKYRPDVNARDRNGETVLPFLLERSSPGPDTTKILRLLIAAGADVNHRDDNGRTPIFKACYQGSEAVHILAQAGADLDAKDHFGETALMSCRNPPYVQAMIQEGATPTTRNPQAHRPY